MVKILVVHPLRKTKPESSLSEKFMKALEENPEAKIDRINGIYENPEGRRIYVYEAPNAEVVEKIEKDHHKPPYNFIFAIEKDLT